MISLYNFQWFTKTKNTKSYFSVTFGICPYCKNVCIKNELLSSYLDMIEIGINSFYFLQKISTKLI